MMGPFEDRTALVTGAGRGIGRAVAVELARAGARTVLMARSQDELAESARLVRAAGGEALVVQGDLSRPDRISDLLGGARDDLGDVDVLVNNAGVVWPLGPSAAVDAAEWAAAIDVNLVSAATLTFALLPGMLSRKWGRIVNVSSGVAERPTSMIGANAYATAKAALEAHTVNLAAEVAGSGVTVNAFRPGRVDTAMQTWIRERDPEEIGAALHEQFTDYHRAGLISPEESARSLVSRLPGDATGQTWKASDPV
ncbi:SDR family NAD(P)-dependent oxidoreductase [Planotetraspora kaengkrachanensis]|uniref:Beta-ketoacyl-ACP reductase n=1 Tax=Planotetraspora kaengkrachanensis TaxID=575193 RepID=A0A8J3Q0H3_9ACTN|nr:SDR family NAD(P)-dependent oxidoreductase [Planotetraspora kaengkrachanensis]GIG84634.1 beta-ketoacyl-ACP reductase [Planotetraspora kaengkrachanensis]